jgi:RNA polymerase sigma-70 factor (ECF subfamily)
MSTTNAMPLSEQRALLAAARASDDRAYDRLVEPHRRELHAHCYRMLGSVHDADDALQDALLRAWRALGRFEGDGPLRPWLYRIATNTCLDLIGRRRRRQLPPGLGPAADPAAAPGRPLTESVWIEPYADEWLSVEDDFAAPGGALRGARGDRARVHRRAAAAARPPARRPDPP